MYPSVLSVKRCLLTFLHIYFCCKVAKHELHATTALRRPNRAAPTRIGRCCGSGSLIIFPEQTFLDRKICTVHLWVAKIHFFSGTVHIFSEKRYNSLLQLYCVHLQSFTQPDFKGTVSRPRDDFWLLTTCRRKTTNTAPTSLSAIQAASQSTFINAQLCSTCD